MKRKHESRCERHPKRKPYGTKGTNPYCWPHDQHMTYTVSKGSERQRAKREITQAPHEPEYDPREYIEPCEDPACSVCQHDQQGCINE